MQVHHSGICRLRISAHTELSLYYTTSKEYTAAIAALAGPGLNVLYTYLSAADQ